MSAKPGSAGDPPAIQQPPETHPPEAVAPGDHPISTRPVERLFPFVLRSRILIIGRDTLRHSKGRLHFVLVTTDIADSSRAEVLADFKHYPIVQHYTGADLEKFFGIRGAKTIGFAKSGLAKSIYAELKGHLINQPVTAVRKPVTPPEPPGTGVPARTEERH
jgi:hypothetical protein